MAIPTHTHDSSRTRFLPHRGTLVLDNAEGTVIEVERGCLWLTLERDPRDVILAGGMRFEIDRAGRTVIVAEQDTCLRVRHSLGVAARTAAWISRVVGPAYTHWAERSLRRALHYF